METKSFKTVQEKFRGKFNFNSFPQKSQIYRWVQNFQATGSVNNLNQKAEYPGADRKLIARCSDASWMQREILSEGVRKSFSENSPKNFDFHEYRCKESEGRIFSCMHKISRWSIETYQLKWIFLCQ